MSVLDKYGAKTRYDIATFLTFGGVAGLADLVWNVFAHGDAYAATAVGGAIALGIKKYLFEDDRSRPPTDVKDDTQ